MQGIRKIVRDVEACINAVLNCSRTYSHSHSLYNPMKLFHEKFYICDTCHKRLHKSGVLCQAACNKWC